MGIGNVRKRIQAKKTANKGKTSAKPSSFGSAISGATNAARKIVTGAASAAAKKTANKGKTSAKPTSPRRLNPPRPKPRGGTPINDVGRKVSGTPSLGKTLATGATTYNPNDYGYWAEPNTAENPGMGVKWTWTSQPPEGALSTGNGQPYKSATFKKGGVVKKKAANKKVAKRKAANKKVAKRK